MAELLITLVWSIIMVLASVISGYTRYNCFYQDSNASAYFNAISTGVILSAAFTHLLPDAMASLEMFKYPVACACALLGFLCMVVVETILTYRTLEDEHQTQNAFEVHSKHDCSVHNNEGGLSPVHNYTSKGVPSNVFSRIPQYNEKPSACYNRSRLPSDPIHTSYQHDHSHEHDLEQEPMITPNVGKIDYGSATHSHSHGHSHNHGPSSPVKSSSNFASIQAFWMALVIHSTMEGLGIGAADSYISQISVVFAILIHKIFESIALAGILIDGKVNFLRSRVMFTVFALATPTGALCTAFMQSYIESSGDNDTTGKILDGVVTALAAGSFMYIGTMEMLPNMLNACHNMPVAMSMFILSAGIMAALASVI